MRNRILYTTLVLIFFLVLGWHGTGSSNSSKATAVSTGSEQTQKSKHFYFVQITDTHFGDADHIERTERIVDRINRLPMKVEFVVHTGDITMDRILDPSTVNRGLSVLNRLVVPIHYVPGNHDILTENLDETIQAYSKNFAGLITSEKYGGVTFIFVYTEPLVKDFLVNGYEPLKQLKKILEEPGNDPVIICHHAPCVKNFYGNEMHKGWKAGVRDRWKSLINSHNVKAVIAGHFHRDEHHWLGTVPLYVSPPVAG
ncbi:MAG: metallophosphoesterase, partial [Deltaproteobacteria bacterium]|nr:metallophosphoesterase [Deltaproteobacteria bacterium]